jgi:hypothetical protein
MCHWCWLAQEYEAFYRICEGSDRVLQLKVFNNLYSKQDEVLDGDRDGKYVDSDVSFKLRKSVDPRQRPRKPGAPSDHRGRLLLKVWWRRSTAAVMCGGFHQILPLDGF